MSDSFSTTKRSLRKRWFGASRLGIVAGILFGAVVATGVSWASIPDASGIIHGCYKPKGSSYTLKVIDTAKHASCPAGYSALNWNQTGPAATAVSASGGVMLPSNHTAEFVVKSTFTLPSPGRILVTGNTDIQQSGAGNDVATCTDGVNGSYVGNPQQTDVQSGSIYADTREISVQGLSPELTAGTYEMDLTCTQTQGSDTLYAIQGYLTATATQ